MRALSKGNRQKVQLIAALATRADLLVLDEPTSGLDPLMEVVFREAALEAKGRGQAEFLKRAGSRPESITGRHPPVTTKRARHA